MRNPMKDDRRTLRLRSLGEQVFRVSLFDEDQQPGSGLNRYGFLSDNFAEIRDKDVAVGDSESVSTSRGALEVSRGEILDITLRAEDGSVVLAGVAGANENGGFILEFQIADDERFHGLGDQTRERIEHRGTTADLAVRNVSSYIPIPFVMSTRGYGLLVNTTYRHAWDLGARDGGTLRIFIPDGQLDVYLFTAPSIPELLDQYTRLTGRPYLPPKWSFGMWFICRINADDHEVMSDAVNLRDRGVPCDVISLEPGWMETNYDASLEKRWDEDRFRIPPWAPNGPHTFISALKRMGYRLGLWLCENYDFTYQAERRVGNDAGDSTSAIHTFLDDDTEKDTHFMGAKRLDEITKPDEPWFEHLKKFVDQGADFFKQDGAWQVCEHPDRFYGNGKNDAEMHNLHPLLYSRQMHDGFREHTGRRPCCFTPAGWAGLQRYTGTWTGDTGGGFKTLVACLNLALSGHSYVTCDMEVTTKEGIHYGFLMPWAQVNSWNYFRHPWLLGDELFPVFQAYAQLRSRLVPYLYTHAHVAHTTGLPMMRPLVLEYPDDPKVTNLLTHWFLGRELLTASFTDEVYLPEGKWLDVWTGEVHTGPTTMQYSPPERRGGPLFLRENSILPLGPVRQHVEQNVEEGMTLKIFLNDDAQAAFTLYDDDGVSYEYEQGRFSLHELRASLNDGVLAVDYPEDIRVDRIEAHLPDKPAGLRVNGNTVEFEWNAGTKTVTAPRI
ncbi:MAG: glycoside hydrolase family 31 protein [Phycisphaerae bacterium]|nr:glycoside hydrolase family 31 protein [Phycisphaerae bacterium]